MDNKEEKPRKDKEFPKPVEPKAPEVEPEILIDLATYCSGLDYSGVDRFAETMLLCEINSGRVPAGNKARNEWEAIYLKLKNS